ncbi:phage conserved hypothetical protein, phiE125 gp8 family [Jannaschia faecimaris]|uniref:Phage gp6-like head-tail connector protein n=2 Tax=Jannaschia faecimaris TaxID=1244108 RepID=A0A1H3RY88_9RHOB|nr:phage conserved hypothetical protein, phiE125 gp8 family [Jannaschia faecimaris]
MAMMVQGSDGIEDDVLPVADLAASMRLADGFESVPGQMARLRGRLRAAIAIVETRTSKVLVAREFMLRGVAKDGTRQAVSISPLVEVIAAEVQQGTTVVDLGEVLVEPHPHRAVLVFERSLRVGAVLTLRVTAGYSAWSQVPAPLREAVLMIAQGLDSGDDVTAQAESLMAPYRALRIGGRG